MMKIAMDKATVRQMEQNIKKVLQQVRYQSHEALVDEADIIEKESSLRVPVHTGALRASIYIKSIIEQDLIKVYVGYGGINTQSNPLTFTSTNFYSMQAHELAQASEINLSVGRGSKFLELSVNDAKVDFANSIARRISKAFRSIQQTPRLRAVTIKPYYPISIIHDFQEEDEKDRQRKAMQAVKRRQQRQRGGA